jgi:hypothetical protein
MKNTNMITMKTAYILAAFLGLQFNTIFAAVHYNTTTISSNDAVTNVDASALMPVTPSTATFEDAAEVISSAILPSGLSPVTPAIADFSDGAPVMEAAFINLAPVTPKEADFNDESENNISAKQDLAPVTPVHADFEDQV